MQKQKTTNLCCSDRKCSMKTMTRWHTLSDKVLAAFSSPEENTYYDKIKRGVSSAHLLLEEVLSVLQGAQLDLFLLVLQLGVRQSEVGDQVVERLENLLDGQNHRRAVLGAQTVQLSAWTDQMHERKCKTHKCSLTNIINLTALTLSDENHTHWTDLNNDSEIECFITDELFARFSL